MKEKDRKRLEIEKFLELTKATAEIMQPPKKDIDTLIRYHASVRQGLVEEVFENMLGEYNNITLKLERYGEGSKFWQRSEGFTYTKDSNAKSERPSPAWLRSKVKCYESQATI